MNQTNFKARPCAVVVLACLVAALAAEVASAQSVSRLQLLVNDSVAQLKLVYRHNAPEQRRRYEQLTNSVAAWRAAERTDDNNRLLEDWLRSAIRSSMPGSHEPLPPVPKFNRTEPRPVLSAPIPATTDAPAAEPLAPTTANSASTPRDLAQEVESAKPLPPVEAQGETILPAIATEQFPDESASEPADEVLEADDAELGDMFGDPFVDDPATGQ